MMKELAYEFLEFAIPLVVFGGGGAVVLLTLAKAMIWLSS